MRKSNNYSLSLISILFTITASIGTLLSVNHVSAESKTVNAAVTVPEACTMTSTNTVPHTATLSPNTYSGASNSEYENGIGKTTLAVVCNDSNGFAIYAIGYTDNKYEGDNHTKLIGQNTNSTIDTAVYTNNSTPSNWSMKVNKVTDDTISYNPQNMSILSNFDSWHIVPATYTKVAQFHASTGSSVTDDTLGAKVETTYASYIAQNQPADTYIGQVKYTMVHPYTEAPLQPQPSTSGCINYFPNGSNVEGTMGCQPIYYTDTSARLLASNFSRTGYGFAGWSNKFDYATNPNQEGIKFYGPQEDITFTAGEYTGSNNGLALYAVWVKSQGSIQNQEKVASVCSSLTTAPTDGTANLTSVSALTDQRDNNTYAIAKLADGKCWMIENLRLDNSAALTIANTNKPLNDGTNVTLKHNYSDTETYNTLSASQDPTTTAWCQSDSASCDDQSMLFTGNTTNRKTNSVDNSGNIYSYGNYYNWYSTTAGRGTYSFNTNNDSVAGDLCPAGWHLPKGGSSTNATNSDFWQLGLGTMGAAPSNNSQYTSSETNSAGKTATAAFRSYPNNFVYSGYVYGGSVNVRGSYGHFWSSTALSSAGYAYSLGLYSSYVYPGTGYYNKYYGGTVRCVAPGF